EPSRRARRPEQCPRGLGLRQYGILNRQSEAQLPRAFGDEARWRLQPDQRWRHRLVAHQDDLTANGLSAVFSRTPLPPMNIAQIEVAQMDLDGRSKEGGDTETRAELSRSVRRDDDEIGRQMDARAHGAPRRGGDADDVPREIERGSQLRFTEELFD